MHAKANGRSLEAQIRFMLTMLVGLGPSDQDMEVMQKQAQAMKLTDNQAMFGVLARMSKAKQSGSSTGITPLIRRQAPPQRKETNPI
jgi:hypothetical protein